MVKLAQTFIQSFSSDKAKGYIMIAIFLMGLTGWGFNLNRGAIISDLETINATLHKAATDNATMAVQYEKKCRGGGFRYTPGPAVRERVLSAP